MLYMNFSDNFENEPIQSTKIEYICESISALDTSRLMPENRYKAEELISRLLYIGPNLHVEPDHPSIMGIIGWVALTNEFSDKWEELLNYFTNLDTATLETPEIEFQEQLTAIQNRYTAKRKILHDQIYSQMVADPDGFLSNLNDAFNTLHVIEDRAIVTNIYVVCFTVIYYSYTDVPGFDLSSVDSFTKKRIVMALFKLLCLISTSRLGGKETELTGIAPDHKYLREISLQLFELFASSLHKDIARVLIHGGNVANLFFELNKPEDSIRGDSQLLISCREYFGEDFSSEYLNAINTIVSFVRVFKSIYSDNGFEHLFPKTEL
jgi:hypothetical protein